MDTKKILAEVKENTRKLDSCDRHLFNGERVPFGKKYTCLKCGGKLNGTDVLYYINGYEAAGGDCDDIYPGWRGSK